MKTYKKILPMFVVSKQTQTSPADKYQGLNKLPAERGHYKYTYDR